MTPPSTAVKTAIAPRTSRWAMARGHRLNTSIVLAAVHGLSGLFRAVSAVEPSLFRPLQPPVPVPNKRPRFCGRKAKWPSRSRQFCFAAGHLNDVAGLFQLAASVTVKSLDIVLYYLMLKRDVIASFNVR